MFNVNDVIGMNFKDEKQTMNRMKIVIIRTGVLTQILADPSC